MNLFVGNISRNISESDLKKEFGRFGECNVEKRVLTALIPFKCCNRAAMDLLNTQKNLMPKKQKENFRDITSVA